MEGIRTFLESSSIHGLSYISTTQKYVRLFWTLVVISGFTVAFLIIEESFISWSESPVKTTVETLPISEVTFPKVTVCPPKNTYTDLNYDLMLTANMTLTEAMRDEIFEYAFEVLTENTFPMTNWSKLHEEDRGYNWYHGYTRIIAPLNNANGLNIRIESSASSGVVTTQYYTDPFQPNLVDRKLHYEVKVYPPENDLVNDNLTLHFQVEKVSMKTFARGSHSMDNFCMENTGGIADATQKTVYQNFTAPSVWRYIELSRNVRSDEVENMKLDLTPGFRFKWWYTGAEVTSETIFKDDDINKQFVRLDLSNKLYLS